MSCYLNIKYIIIYTSKGYKGFVHYDLMIHYLLIAYKCHISHKSVPKLNNFYKIVHSHDKTKREWIPKCRSRN